MNDDPEIAGLREAARAEIEFLGELRRNSFEQHTHSFRWLTASLLAINGGAAIAILNSTILSPFSLVTSGACFTGGILSALMVGVLAQRSIMASLIPIQTQIGYWIGVVSDGTRDEVKEQSFINDTAHAVRSAKIGQVAGWISAVLFVSGLGFVAVDILNPVKVSPYGQSADNNGQHNRSNHLPE